VRLCRFFGFDIGGVLLSDPLLWSQPFQTSPQTVSGRAWLHLLHPEDQPLVIGCLVSVLNPDRLMPQGLSSTPTLLVLRLRAGECYVRYQVQAVPVLLSDLTYHWVFVAQSLEPTVAAYAERNLLSVLIMAVSLARTGLESLTALHNESLRPPLCRRLAVAIDHVYGYLDHLEQGVRYLSEGRH